MTILKMTLEQAIQHAKNQADALAGTPCGEQHAQLSGWLTELLAVREAQSKPVAWQQRFSGDHWLSCSKPIFDYLSENPDPIVEVREVYAAPPALPANVIGRPATPDDSPYPATISGGCLLAQAWADGYNVRNAVTAAPAPAVPENVAAALDWIDDFISRCNGDDRGACNSVNVLRAAMLNHSGGSTEKVPAGFKLVPVELLSTASMLIDLCRTHTTLNGGGTYNQRVLSDCETTMNAIAILLAAAPTPTK